METDGTVVLELFVQGQSARSSAALDVVRKVCDAHLASRYRLEVIDVQQQPERTRGASIVAAPALIRRSPEPVLRITGLLTEERILTTLGLGRV